MGFQPGMRSVREGISVIGSLKCRSWNGVIADLWQAECQAGATGEYVSDHPRLFIVLDKVGGSFETRLDPSEPGVSPRGGAHSISFMPAGVPVWGRTQQRMRIRPKPRSGRWLSVRLSVERTRRDVPSKSTLKRAGSPQSSQ